MRWLIVSFALLPTFASADIFDRVQPFQHERYSVDASLIDDCMRSIRFDGDFRSNAEKTCVGTGASKCLEESASAETAIYDRLSYGNCIGLEKGYWDWRLGQTVAALSGASLDKSEREHLLQHVPELEATIASWRAFMTVRCRYASHTYGVAPSRGREGDIAMWACQNRHTAKFAIDLEAQFRGYCG